MLRVTQRIRRISESLVDFSRVRKQHMEPVPLRPLIDDAWNLVAHGQAKAARARFANQVLDGHVVTGNSDRLVQVFVNLLRNALYAIPAERRHRGAFPAPESQRAIMDLSQRRGQWIGHSLRMCSRIFSRPSSPRAWTPMEPGWD
jgi:C4-dicarboxylate-specific signal transduction histidine kinase